MRLERSYNIDVSFGAPTLDCIGFDQETTRLAEGTLVWRRGARRSWMTGDRHAGVRLTLAPSAARIRVWNADAPATVLAFRVALCEAMRSAGLAPLHAAVAERSGRATAFLGPSGVGKSTVLRQAVEQGWTPLADDFAWLEPGSLAITASKSDRLATADQPTSTLTRILVLSRGETLSGAWRLEPMRPRDVARAWWESSGVPLCRLNRDAFAAQVPGLVERVPARRLVLGRGAPPLGD